MTTRFAFLRLPALIERVGLSRAQIYRLVQRGEFPRPVRIGSVSVWPSDEIDNWMREHVERAQRSRAA